MILQQSYGINDSCSLTYKVRKPTGNCNILISSFLVRRPLGVRNSLHTAFQSQITNKPYLNNQTATYARKNNSELQLFQAPKTDSRYI